MRAVGLVLWLCASAALAQIRADATLGTQVSRTGDAWSISAGTQLGGNLFHSFSRFNVATGQSATFSGPASVQHIVGRVTGPEASSIDGLLRSTIPGASLWLINPRGFAFGPGARLDVPGAFHVSTADYLALGQGGRFDVTHPAASTLTSAPPGAFGFVGPAAAPLSFDRARLFAAPGTALSVVGGDVTLANADLRARGGELLIEATSGGRVLISGSNVDADSRNGLAAGTVAIRGGEIVAVDTFITSLNRSAGAGGGVRIDAARRFVLDSGAVQTIASSSGAGGRITVSSPVVEIIRSGQLDASASGEGAGGAIHVLASESLSISGGLGPYLSGLYSEAGSRGGSGGAIVVEAGRLRLDKGALISSITDGVGDAGSVTLIARDIALSNGAYVDTSTYASGGGGAVAVRAGNEFRIEGVDRGGNLGGIFALAAGTGGGGAISVDAERIFLSEGIVSSRTVGAGASGNIALAAREILVLNGSFVDANTYGAGRGGSIAIRAGERLEISGRNRYGNASGVFALAGAGGDAGSIDIVADTIELGRGIVRSSSLAEGRSGAIDVSAREIRVLGGGRFNTGTEGSGAGSTMRLAVSGTLLLEGVDPASGFYSGLLSTSLGSGNGGSIEVTAGDIVVRNGARITAAAFREGTAGSLLIQAANSIVLSADSAITTEAASTDGGDIVIRARNLLHLKDSAITTSVGTGSGNGGNITIDPQFVVLDDSRIVANAFGGDGGNISIVAGGFLTQNSVVQASSALGISGSIEIAAPRTDVTGSLAVLDSAFFDAASLIRESCSARAGRASSSLSGAGRGGLARSPMQDAGGSGIVPAVKTSAQGGGPWVAARSGCS